MRAVRRMAALLRLTAPPALFVTYGVSGPDPRGPGGVVTDRSE